MGIFVTENIGNKMYFTLESNWPQIVVFVECCIQIMYLCQYRDRVFSWIIKNYTCLIRNIYNMAEHEAQKFYKLEDLIRRSNII